MPVYVSTSCLAGGSNVFDVLDTYARVGLKNIELGTKHEYINDLSPARFRQYDLNLLCHHYFPPPEEPFMINLASQDSAILKRSKEQVRRSIDFCYSLGINLFSLHAGFRADPDETLNLKGKPVASYESAFNTFIESIDEVISYAEKRKVRIGIENNVLSEYNVIDGKNPYLLLCEAEEFEKFLARVHSDSIGIVLDLGHLNVTAHSLGFDKYEFIDRVEDRVFAIHVHENNGQVDEHKELDKTSWCFEVIDRKCLNGLPVVFESFGLTVNQIVQQVRLIEKILGKGQD